MRLLLDTHVVLWLIEDNPKLGRAMRAIVNEADSVTVSVVSLWEMTIKVASGKLALPADLRAILLDSGISFLPVELRHVDALGGLADHHRDPFDRMLVAQARAEGLTLVSADRTIKLYDVPVLWS